MLLTYDQCDWNNTEITFYEENTKNRNLHRAASMMLITKEMKDPSVELDITWYAILATEFRKGILAIDNSLERFGNSNKTFEKMRSAKMCD